MTTPADPIPSDLAGAHALIVSLRSEALIRRLETEKLKFLIAKLRREQYGPSSERGKLLVEQLELAIADIEESQGAAEAEADIAARTAAAAARQSRPARSQRPTLPENLPVERVVYPVPCACDRCGGARLRKLGEVVSRTLECEPRRWKIVEHVREKMTCRDCEAVTETPAPSHPIPRGFAGPNLLASVLVSKFMLHQPLNRQSDTFAREGIAIDTSTLADRVGACAVALAPIVEAIGRHVLAATRIHADDTTVPVLAKGKTHTGRLWTIEFLAERHWHGVLQLRAAHLDHGRELDRFCLEGIGEVVEGAGERRRGEDHRKTQRRRIGVVSRLRHVDVVVGMERIVGAPRMSHLFQSKIGDDLVCVHVRRSAGASLHCVDNEGMVVRARRNGAAGCFDGGSLLGLQEAEPPVGPCGRLLHQCEGANEVGEVAYRHARDREILHRPHRVDTPERVGRHVGFPQEVVLAAGLCAYEVDSGGGGERDGPLDTGRSSGLISLRAGNLL